MLNLYSELTNSLRRHNIQLQMSCQIGLRAYCFCVSDICGDVKDIKMNIESEAMEIGLKVSAWLSTEFRDKEWKGGRGRQ